MGTHVSNGILKEACRHLCFMFRMSRISSILIEASCGICHFLHENVGVVSYRQQCTCRPRLEKVKL